MEESNDRSYDYVFEYHGDLVKVKNVEGYEDAIDTLMGYINTGSSRFIKSPMKKRITKKFVMENFTVYHVCSGDD